MCKNVNVEDFKIVAGKSCEGDGQDCAGAKCPMVSLDSEGNALIQGIKISSESLKKMVIPDDEEIVYLPNRVIQELFSKEL